ncbi:MAG: lectin-like protein, partial [Cyanobacteria bacterium P01_F01_bin.3]
MTTSVAAVAAGVASQTQAGPMFTWDGNGHTYELTLNEFYSWTDARQLALDKGGYLATITSQEEQDAVAGFVFGQLFGDGDFDWAVWLGGYDADNEESWVWADGPEAGQQFWQGKDDGSPTDGAFVNWDGGEPNFIFGLDEDYLGLYVFGGEWNDFPNDPVNLLTHPITTGLQALIEYEPPGGESY